MPGFAADRLARRAFVLIAVAGLSACGGAGKDAATQVSVFLTAARTDNRMVFEERVDRGRVRDDMRAQFANIPGVQDLQAQIGEGIGEGALDRMISPDTIRRLERVSGGVAPSVADLKPRLRSVDGGRLCLKDAGDPDRCLMTFAELDKTWKLVGLYAEPQSFALPEGQETPSGPEDPSED